MSLAPLTELFQDGLLVLAKETALPNWDDEGAQAIPATEWTGVSQFVTAARTRFAEEQAVAPRFVVDMAVPEVAPCGDGTIHMTWWHPVWFERHAAQSRLLIEWRERARWWSRRGRTQSDRRTDHGAFASNEEALDFLLAWWRGE